MHCFCYMPRSHEGSMLGLLCANAELWTPHSIPQHALPTAKDRAWEREWEISPPPPLPQTLDCCVGAWAKSDVLKKKH